MGVGGKGVRKGDEIEMVQEVYLIMFKSAAFKSTQDFTDGSLNCSCGCLPLGFCCYHAWR